MSRRTRRSGGDETARLTERIDLSGDVVTDTLELLSTLASATDRRAAAKWGIPQSVSMADVLATQRGNW